jgi:hypothetical protein
MYSTDGFSWSTPTTQSGFWTSVTYGNGVFAAIGVNVQMRSSDGFTWTDLATLTGIWTSVAYGNGMFVAVGQDKQMSSNDGANWYYADASQNGGWRSVTYGTVQGVALFVAVSSDNKQMYSVTATSWFLAALSAITGDWQSVTYGTIQGAGRFVAVSNSGNQIYSSNGTEWSYAATQKSGNWGAVTRSVSLGGFENITAIGNYIYASSQTEVFQIDTTKDLSTPSAYKHPAPITVDGSAPKIFAYGPRYIYMFTSDPTMPMTVHYSRYDPYSQNPIFQATIIADYESGTAKPDKALIGIVQTQKITNMSLMDIHGPVKEFWVTGKSSNVFQYANLSNHSTLTLTAGEELVTPDIGTNTFLGTIQPFETHTSMPIRNVSVLSMEIDPESDIPNGTVNFSRINDQIFDGNAQTLWVRNYNILAIQGGVGGLMFN